MWKKPIIVMTLAGILFLTACGSENVEIEEVVLENTAMDEMQNENPMESESELTGELTILSYTHGDMWEPIMNAFMEEYPGVTITVDKPSAEEEQTEHFYKKYMVKIMSGEGIDVVMTDFVSMEKYGADMGLFVDLYEYMDADEAFDREDYFSCIFGPVETDGKLFRLIRSVQPVYVRLNKALLEQAGVEYAGETISFEDLYEIYGQVCEQVEENIYLVDYGRYDPLGRYENGYFIRNNMFDSDEYEAYLRMNHELYYTSESRPEWTEYGQGIEEDVLCRVIAGLPLQENDSVVNSLFKESEDMTAVIPYEGLHGEKYFEAASSLAISNFSEDKELAWEFLKFVISNHDFGYEDDAFLSPNKEKTENLCKGLEPEAVTQLFQDIEEINTVRFWDFNLTDNLYSVYEDYYINNSISVEECQKELADRVYLYMNE